MRHFAVVSASAALCALVVAGAKPAAADVLVNVSKASQRMSVLVDGNARYNWQVSTGAARHTTPSGVYKPEWLARRWKSKQYNNAPMPYSIFFHKGYAIHGTTEVARLGKIASHGCVRLAPENAAKLFALVQKDMASTRIVVSNDVIEKPGQAPKKKDGQYIAQKAELELPVANKRKPESVAMASVKASEPATTGSIIAASAAKKIVTPVIVTPVVEKIQVRAKAEPIERVERARPRREARLENVARVERSGFHW
jgi:hypothetical protein